MNTEFNSSQLNGTVALTLNTTSSPSFMWAGIPVMILGLISVSGNGLILVLVSKYSVLQKNPVSALIGILAGCDFLFGFDGFLNWSIVYGGVDYVSRTTCLSMNSVYLFAMIGSHLFTASIAFDRVQAMYDPLPYALVNRWTSTIVRVVGCLLVALVSSLSMLGGGSEKLIPLARCLAAVL